MLVTCALLIQLATLDITEMNAVSGGVGCNARGINTDERDSNGTKERGRVRASACERGRDMRGESARWADDIPHTSLLHDLPRVERGGGGVKRGDDGPSPADDGRGVERLARGLRAVQY